MLGFAAFLAGVGATFLLLTPSPTTTPDRTWALPFLVLVVAFALAEGTALHIEVRKESHSLSLSGIPLMFGLLYLSPIQLAAAYVLGAAPAMLWIRKSDAVKTAWNSCLFFAEAAVAAFIVQSMLGPELPDRFVEWLIPLAAVLVAELMSLFAVPLVIMAVDAKFRPNLFADVGQSQVLAALGGTFTVTVLSGSIGEPIMVLYAFVPLAGVGLLLRKHGQLLLRHQDLSQLHRFTSALAYERGSRTIDTGLIELVKIMRSTTACLLTVDHDSGSWHLRSLIDDQFVDIDPDVVRERLLEYTEPSGVTRLAMDDERPRVRRLLDDLGARELLAAPVLKDVSERGVVFVTDRLGMHHSFSAEEHALFGSLAGTLDARLSNDYLVQELEIQAQHDALTGLPNRLSFEVALTSTVGHPAHKTPGKSGAVVMIDLDRFKEINDSLGHDTGDKLLIEVANRLKHGARSTDMVARLGGDEFAILLVNRASDAPGDLTRRISEIYDRLTAKVELDGIAFDVGASLGVAQWPEQGSDSHSLLRSADTAMYQAKRNQVGVVWYTPELDIDAPRRLDLYLSVHAAVDSEDLFVHFQPKICVADGTIAGVEALVRWVHPKYGLISPNEFIPLISHAGLTRRLTRFVLRRSVEAVAMLDAAGLEIPIAVNLTPRDLLDSSLPDELEQILAELDVAPERLMIEITEDAMVVDFDTSISVLTRIRDLGVSVALDDFGTGYSSLKHLHRLPIDQIKIDRSFVTTLETDRDAHAIVRAAANLSRDLSLSSVAEGVENDYMLRTVANLGCQQIQGYMISKPLAITELIRWASEWNPSWLVGRLAQRPLVPEQHGDTGEAERARSFESVALAARSRPPMIPGR